MTSAPGGRNRPRRSDLSARLPLRLRRHAPAWAAQRPTWREARPALISGLSKRALARPAGNWFVVGASRDVPADRPLARTVAGQEVVLWRDAEGTLVGGPGICPHLGAPLREGPVRCGTLMCRWHGLALDGTARAGWQPYPVHDDGILVWVRLDEAGGEDPLPAPLVPPRPGTAGALDAVHVAFGTCEPEDVVANRLDPWHGAWFHPYSFVDLTVVSVPDPGREDGEDTLVVDVAFKVTGGSSCRSAPSSPRQDPAPSSCASPRGRGGAPSSRRTPRRSARTAGAARAPPSSRPSSPSPNGAASPSPAGPPPSYGP